MASYNHVTLMGNLTRDAEVRFTPNGKAIATINLAINRTWKDAQSGEKREEVSFIECTAFGRTAEVAGQYCRKGNPLLIDGRLQQQTWEDKQTQQNRSKVVVIVENLVLCGGRREDDEQGGGRQTNNRASADNQPRGQRQDQDEQPPAEDDVPF